MPKRIAGWAATLAAVGIAVIFSAGPAWAAKASVLEATATCEATLCDFKVRLRHHDEGWEHYVDRWEVLDPDGNVLATRVLRHPHVDDQPLERRQNGVEIPLDVERVIIRAHDTLHGFGGKTVVVELGR